MSLHPRSLQTRLMVLAAGVLIAIWVGTASMTWLDASHELDELLDGHLAQAAALLVVQQTRADGDDDDGVADAPSLHKYAPKVAFQVFHEGILLMRSANAGTVPMTSREEGFQTVRLADGIEWRVFSTRGAENDVRVIVGEQTASRNSILLAVLRSLLLPLLVALPVLVLALWWAVRQGLMPLWQLGSTLRKRQPQALEPVVLTDMPSEMRPMVQALNGLLERIERMVTAERRFTADAAHELRTPIAAIRTQAQVAQGAGDDIAEREHALGAMLAGCDRASRVVDQMLMLARLEATVGAASPETPATPVMDLGAVVRRVAADLVPTALARGQTLEVDADTPCVVAGDEMLVCVLVRNLMDNALRYSPDAARVRVAVASQPDQVVLSVQDSGPGMSEAEIARLGERFYRVLGSGQTGSGLGWSIVKRVADVTGAQLRVGRSDALGGLAVWAGWPPHPGG